MFPIVTLSISHDMIMSIVKRASYLILRGLVGISKSEHFSATKKAALYYDYCRLILLSLQLPFRHDLIDSSVDKVFHMKSLNFSIHYPNIYAFFFLFNEIFCIQEYPVIRDLHTYVDLGAYIGMSVLWYHAFNPKVKIYAFEPNENNYQYLLRNIRANKIQQCQAYKTAVSNKAERVRYYEILDNIQSLDSGLFLNQELPYNMTYVKAEKLSDRIKKIGEISLLKMDIEGSEYVVFEDIFASNTLSKIRRIIFESHLFTLSNTKSHASVLRQLGKFGTVTSTSNSRLTSIDSWERARVQN